MSDHVKELYRRIQELTGFTRSRSASSAADTRAELTVAVDVFTTEAAVEVFNEALAKRRRENG